MRLLSKTEFYLKTQKSMKRPLLTLTKILNVIPLLILGLISVTSVQSYAQEPDISYSNVCCGCNADLVPGYFIARITLLGDQGENVVLCNADMIFDVTNLTAPYTLLPDLTAFTEVVPGRYVLEAIIFNGMSPSFDLKYEQADGSFAEFAMEMPTLPGSCSVHSVGITSDSGTEACSNSMNSFVFTATNSQTVDPYSYEWFLDGVSQGPASGFSNNPSNFTLTQNLPPGTYILSVVGYRDPSTCTTSTMGAANCEIFNEIVVNITDQDAEIAGPDMFCNDGDLIKNYNITPDPGATASIDWTLKNEDESVAIATYTSTGSGTSIDFSPLPTGFYTLCGSGTSDQGCTLNAEYDINYFQPEATINGVCDVLCSQEETYTLTVDSPVEAGSVTWTVSPAANVTSNASDTSIDVVWTQQMGASISVSGMTEDGCAFSQSKEINFLPADAFVSINGDTDVCMGSTELYTITGLTGDALDNYNYNWTLKNAAGTDVSAGTVLATSNMGQTVPVDFSSLTPGNYTLMVMATSVGGACPNFMSSLSITLDNGDVPTMACVSSGINVTIGNNCELEVTADIIIEGLNASNDQFIVMLTDVATGDLIDGNILDHSNIGQEIEVKVIHECSGNSCWGYLTVEDKSVPVPQCPTIIGIVDCEDIADKTNPDFMPIFAADVTINFQGDNTWELLGYDNCGVATLTCEDENQSTDCANPSTLFRTWTVTDEFGATASCRVELQVMYDEDEKVILPPDFDDIIPGAEPSIDVCSDFLMDENGNPDPDLTGVPIGASCADVEVLGYTDRNLPLCGSGSPARKILRDWVIWDPCANGGLGDDILHTQYITLTDTAPPICAAFDEFAVTTDSHTCSQTIFVPNPQVSNECGSIFIELSYKLRDSIGIIPETFSTEGVTYSEADQGFYIDDVQFLSDSLWVLFEVRDACGNGTTDCLTEVALLDATPPSPVCDLFNNVALNDDGCAYAGPETFDDHSVDNCGVYQKVIKRMDEGVPCGPCEKPQFDYLTFLGERDGHFYYLSDQPTTGPNAFAYSTAIESYVAKIDDAAEGSWLHTQVSSYTSDDYFIGYRGQGITNADSPLNSDFDAQAGGVMNYDNWATGEPSWTLTGTGDLYVTVQSDGTWDAERESISNHMYVVEIEDPCVFSQRVKFCCADIGNQVMVRMRVFDFYGNFAECMVEVEVQDFKDPTVTNVPTNVNDIDCEDLDNTDYLLGELSTFLISEYGEPTFDDNCPFDVEYVVTITSATDCGSFTITRTWTATDTYGNATSVTQILTIGNAQPFVFGNINWPDDYDSNNCQNGILPDELPTVNGFPSFSGIDACSSVTSAWEDQVFNYTEEACSKILRTWTVIDWCQPDEVWTHIQVIKIYDTEPPTVVSGCQNLSEVEGELVGNCMIETWESGLQYSLSDNCSNFNQITVWYDLDLYNDGTNESTGVQSNNANGTYPFGTHKITWYAEDHCGNVLAPCSMTFVVDGDTTGPTAYCLSEVVTVVPVAGTAEIWASDFNQGSYGGGCNTSDDLIYSFSSNTSNTSMSFDCSDVTNGIVDTIPLQMWVTDSNGNQSFCDAFLILQDNHDICQDNAASRVDIAGRVYTEDDQMVENVEVSLMEQNNNPMMVDMTNVQGEFAFDNVPMNNNYYVDPYSNEDPLNGVSTLDILLIQKHILNLIPITSPYKLIAADANNSQSVSAADLIQIRKLVLGVSPDYPNNDSWRFVEQDYVFADNSNPWPFEEVINLNALDSSMSDADFIAVKIGDVNNSAIVNLVQDGTVSRSADKLNLEVKYRETATGNTVVDLLAKDSYRMDGAQLSLDIGMEPSTVSSDLFDLGVTNYAFANGILTISFNDAKGKAVSADDLVMSIEFEGAVEDLAVSLNESFENEIYIDSGENLEVKELALTSESYNLSAGFSVYQNTPNPFSDETVIAFEIPNEQTVYMQIFDNSGKVLYSITNEFSRGYNEFIVKQSDLESTGILYYQISTDTHIATRKMIILK